ncbi:hypothetical protein IVG45_14935 [Methylomonas sp. LL1]|uniref:hypothetical protein n=1 Tax=Methylomonas sp. LL1 TaxID=2785785 RepID=UPI0018C43FCE|nr:hypothetical protein [Methylomonas sp. LL1]QPK62147.1 hypothetical protein IVG45_14935 [Methylomonas sp. LL1]
MHVPDSDEFEDEQPLPSRRHFGIEEGVFILLIILSLLGIIITDFSVHDGYGYWLLMVFVFSLLSLFVSWLQAKTREEDFGQIVKQQGLHWLHTLIIVGAASLLNKSGQLSEIGATLVILLILALSTMLDGARIGWQFSLLGFFLAACAIIVAYVQPFIWACVSLAIVVVIGSFLWGYWASKYRTEDES